MLASLGEFLGLADLDGRVVSVFSRKGTYLSLRLTLPCQSAEQVLEVYARIQAMPQVIRYF